MTNDMELLRCYCEQHSESAFRELVQRHLSLVYHTSLRQTFGESQLAEEAAQAAFVLLSRQAASLLSHPNLLGWLHSTACNEARLRMRSEKRRRQREVLAELSRDLSSPAALDAEWASLRPVIDEALQELPPADREAVLLRYFESRSFAEIGTTLGLGENTVRMRVNRATEKLQALLAKRGIQSTAAALSSILVVPASMAVPPGLLNQVCTAALGAGISATGGLGLVSLVHLMTTAQSIATATGLVALVSLGGLLYQNTELKQARADLAALRKHEAGLSEQLGTLENKLAQTRRLAAEAEHDNEQLLDASASAQGVIKEAAQPAVVTKDLVDQRFRNAKRLAKEGRNGEALRELLWCYDTGMRQVSGFFIPRNTDVLDELVKLSKTYPAALDALKAHRDAALGRLVTSGSDMEAGKDFAHINRVLGETDATIAYFNTLKPEDPRRQHMIDTVAPYLMEQKRYSEYALAMPYSDMKIFFEAAANQAGAEFLVPIATKDVVARIAAGDTASAADMVRRMRLADDSESTQAALRKCLEEAGHPELFGK